VFNDIADVLGFPETPEEMHELLRVELLAKRQHGLTEHGINGYVYHHVFLFKKGGTGGLITRRVSESSGDAEGDRSTDDGSVPVLRAVGS
jgi:hypothetical protein